MTIFFYKNKLVYSCIYIILILLIFVIKSLKTKKSNSQPVSINKFMFPKKDKDQNDRNANIYRFETSPDIFYWKINTNSGIGKKSGFHHASLFLSLVNVFRNPSSKVWIESLQFQCPDIRGRPSCECVQESFNGMSARLLGFG